MSSLHSILEDDMCYGKEQIEEGKRDVEHTFPTNSVCRPFLRKPPMLVII